MKGKILNSALSLALAATPAGTAFAQEGTGAAAVEQTVEGVEIPGLTDMLNPIVGSENPEEAVDEVQPTSQYGEIFGFGNFFTNVPESITEAQRLLAEQQPVGIETPVVAPVEITPVVAPEELTCDYVRGCLDTPVVETAPTRTRRPSRTRARALENETAIEDLQISLEGLTLHLQSTNNTDRFFTERIDNLYQTLENLQTEVVEGPSAAPTVEALESAGGFPTATQFRDEALNTAYNQLFAPVQEAHEAYVQVFETEMAELDVLVAEAREQFPIIAELDETDSEEGYSQISLIFNALGDEGNEINERLARITAAEEHRDVLYQSALDLAVASATSGPTPDHPRWTTGVSLGYGSDGVVVSFGQDVTLPGSNVVLYTGFEVPTGPEPETNQTSSTVEGLGSAGRYNVATEDTTKSEEIISPFVTFRAGLGYTLSDIVDVRAGVRLNVSSVEETETNSAYSRLQDTDGELIGDEQRVVDDAELVRSETNLQVAPEVRLNVHTDQANTLGFGAELGFSYDFESNDVEYQLIFGPRANF
ncbi:hypothetical protein HOI26_00150 [Candidatus Woesearchaeota archaeon]|jgi:hypothetical protein|nr:hypothetical protein [Candidatus Woesearchaeota archaeon]MBT5739485.1 hypothetical protein [Candidatus Woesearchaeota archaeon]